MGKEQAQLALVIYWDHIAFEQHHGPPDYTPVLCSVMGEITAETDDYISLVYRKEGPLMEEPHPRTYGMSIVKGAVKSIERLEFV